MVNTEKDTSSGLNLKSIKIKSALQLLKSEVFLYLRLDLLQHRTGGLIIVQFTGCGQVLSCVLPVAQQPAAAHTHKP